MRAPALLLALALTGDAVAGRPLWTVDEPAPVTAPIVEALESTTAAVIEAPEPELTPSPSPRPTIYRTVPESPNPWPASPIKAPLHGDHDYELGTWTGLARGRSGLDGGLYAAIKWDRVRPALTLAPYRVGVGIGLAVFPVPGLTAGLYYSIDWRTGERAPGVYLALPRW